MNTKRKPNGYWNVYENCYNEAKKYSTLREFFYNSGRCYQVCRKRGWIDSFPWLKRLDRKTEVYWSNGQSKPVVQFSMEGKYIKEYSSGSEAAKALGYTDGNAILNCCKGKTRASHKFRWLLKEDADRSEEIFREREKKWKKIKNKPEGYTKEEIFDEARKYRTKKEFREGSFNYWGAAQRRGLLDLLPFERVLNPYKDSLYSVYAYLFRETHSVYVGITDNMHRRNWQHRNEHKSDIENSAVFKHARDNGLSIPDPVILEEGLDPMAALDKEDAWKEKYKEEGWNILNVAKTGKSSGSLGSSSHLWENKVIEEAKKYKTLREFTKAKPSWYCYALSHGFLNELDFLKRERHKPYTYEECYHAAAQYDTLKDFYSKAQWAYDKSRSVGWINDFTWLQRTYKNQSKTIKEKEVVA